MLFLTAEGMLLVYFGNGKFTVIVKKDCKKVFMMDWIYGSSQTAHFWVAESSGLYLYKF